MQRKDFADRPALVAGLRQHLVDTIASAIRERGIAVLALSGGSTPIPLYAELAGEALDWSRVEFVLVDERWVNMDHAASNEAAIREALAPALVAGATLTGMKNPAATAADGLELCNDAYGRLPRPFDLVLLGMGEDGHTASLFPHADGLDAALADDAPCCVAITAHQSAVTGANTERMTLSLPAIRDARETILLITGDAKQRVLDQAIAGDDVSAMPVRALLQRGNSSLTVWWSP